MLCGEMQACGPGICHSHRRGPQAAGLGQQQDLVPVLWGLPSLVALALVRWLCGRCHGRVFSGRGRKAHDCNLPSSSLAVPPWREEVEAGGTEPRAAGSQARLASGPQWVLGRARRGAVMLPAVVNIWGPATRDSLCWRAPAVLGCDCEEAELPADSGSRLPVAWSPECPWSYCLATATQPKHTMGRDLWAMSPGPGAPKSGFVKPQEAACGGQGNSRAWGAFRDTGRGILAACSL